MILLHPHFYTHRWGWQPHMSQAYAHVAKGQDINGALPFQTQAHVRASCVPAEQAVPEDVNWRASYRFVSAWLMDLGICKAGRPAGADKVALSGKRHLQVVQTLYLYLESLGRLLLLCSCLWASTVRRHWTCCSPRPLVFQVYLRCRTCAMPSLDLRQTTSPCKRR